MGYKKIYQKIYQELLATSGYFDIKDVRAIVSLNSPQRLTKEEINELALNVLDEALNNGMVKMENEGIYISVLSPEKKKSYDEIIPFIY